RVRIIYKQVLKIFRGSNSGVTFLSHASFVYRLLFLTFFFFVSEFFALYNGTPSSPMLPEKDLLFPNLFFSSKAGYEFDDVFNRKLISSHKSDARVKKFSSSDQFGVLTWGFADRVEVFASLGQMSSHMKQHFSNQNAVSYQTHSHFAWSVG